MYLFVLVLGTIKVLLLVLLVLLVLLGLLGLRVLRVLLVLPGNAVEATAGPALAAIQRSAVVYRILYEKKM